jgi:hypothetical protein
MRTTTVVNGGFAHHNLSESEITTAISVFQAQVQSVLETFATTHGVSSNNLVSESVVEIVTEGTPRYVVRTWSDLATAQAWVDCVLAGNLGQGLEYPAMIISAQVDPE